MALVRMDNADLPLWRRPIRVDWAALRAPTVTLPAITAGWRRAIDQLVMAVAGLSAGWALWAFATPAGPIGAWRAGASYGLPASTMSALLASLDPFFRNRPVTSVAADAVSALPLQLFGTRLNRSGAVGAAIIAGADGIQHSVRVGDQVSDGVRLVEVAFDYVVLERQGRRERLYLDPAKAPKAEAQDSVAGAVGTGAGAAAPATSMAIAALGLTPRMQNGQATGLVVRPGGDAAALAAFGLKPGDVVRSVNGTAATSLDALAGLAVPGARLTLEVERGAEVVPVAVDVPGAPPPPPASPLPASAAGAGR